MDKSQQGQMTDREVSMTRKKIAQERWPSMRRNKDRDRVGPRRVSSPQALGKGVFSVSKGAA